MSKSYTAQQQAIDKDKSHRGLFLATTYEGRKRLDNGLASQHVDWYRSKVIAIYAHRS